jgi:hypothetical protein
MSGTDPSEADETPEQLRARARRYREHARGLANGEIREAIERLAAEIEARAERISPAASKR